MTKSTTRIKADVAGIAGRKNLIINGGFDVWQRGTSFTPTGADYMADRWFMGGGDYACTATKQASTLPDGSEVNTMRISYTASGTNYIDLYQGIENFKALSGKTVTLSCWVKTNISGLSYRQYSTQQFGSAAVADGQWHKLVSTVQLGAITGVSRGANSPFFGVTSGTTIVTKAGDYLEITQFQLELGSVATDFEHRSYGEELALCERYYSLHSFHIQGYPPTGGFVHANVHFRQTMRTSPTTLIVVAGNVSGANSAVAGHDISDRGLRLEHQTSGNNTRLFHLGGLLKADAEL